MKTLLLITFCLTLVYASPLHNAVSAVNEERVHALVHSGEDINARDSKGKTPLHLAASIGRYSLVKYLVENGADLHVKDNAHKTALVYAIEKNRVKVIIYLSQQVNAHEPLTEDNGVFAAARAGNKELLAYHLSRNDINSVNQDGKTALHIACEVGNLEIVTFLLSLGADKEVRDHDGRTALNYAKLTGNKALIELLSNP